MSDDEAPIEPRSDGIHRVQRLSRVASRFAMRHLTVLVAGTTSLLVVLKILSVADFDLEVALGLLTASDTSRVAIAIAITLLPIIAVVLTVIAWLAAVSMEGEGSRAAAIVGGTVLFVVAARVTPLNQGLLLFMLIVYTLILAYATLASMHTRYNSPAPADANPGAAAKTAKAPDDDKQDGPGVQMFWTVVGLFLLLFIGVQILGPALRDPWMPRELLTFIDSSTTAYVVSIEDGWLTYLEDRDRDLVVTNDILLERTVCPAMGYERSLGEYVAEDIKIDITAVDVGGILNGASALVTYAGDALGGTLETPSC